ITVRDLKRFIREHQKLTIRLSAGTDSRIICSRTTQELQKAWQDTSIRYFLDICTCTDDTITLQGWIVDVTGECFPRITDENGTPLAMQPAKTLRRDLVGALGLDKDFYQDHSWGFSFSMPRNEFHGSALVLHMENSYTVKTLRLPIRRLAFLSSKAGRLPALLTRQTPKKLLTEIRAYGLKGFLKRAKAANMVNDVRYETWLAQHRPGKKA
ncbi:MAG: hypothetical protein LUF30_03025, partial [Lachnospiraceae bacterium]|nr:hypothetical protein [Lachnospiraceae bacterium]